MVIMERFYSQEKCQELWRKIDRLHLGYLELEESPEKIRQREKLEECIAEYLFMARHRDKFVFAETEDVLYRSAAFKKDFSGYKAAPGWNALQMYAANLLTQPWRKEYRQIKTYCGFYKHQIEANLVGAEAMFEAMGFRNIGGGVLVLEGPICPDKVSNISKDCLIAYMECQILKHIWEELSPISNISWLDVLEHRAACPGSIDECVRSLKIKLTSKQAVRHSRASSFDNAAPASSQGSVSSRMVVPNGQNYALAGHNHMALPPMMLPNVPYCMPHTNGCINTFPYGYASYPGQVPVMKAVLPPVAAPHNGYYYANGGIPMVPTPYPVPTGQLVEVDSRNGYDMVDEGIPATIRRRGVESNSVLSSDKEIKKDEVIKNGVKSDSDERHEAVEGDWEYVYRDLERQGYSKDLGERGDILSLTVSDKQRKHAKEPKRVRATNLDEMMNNVSVNDRPLKMTEALEQMEGCNIEKTNVQPAERRQSQGSSYENLTANDSSKQVTRAAISAVPAAVPTSSKPVIKTTTETAQPKKILKAEAKQEEAGAAPQYLKWECYSCTYLNDYSKDICDMCSKSRTITKEPPMEVGGPECSKCTLVNPRTAKTCQACSSSLKNSPTYI